MAVGLQGLTVDTEAVMVARAVTSLVQLPPEVVPAGRSGSGFNSWSGGAVQELKGKLFFPDVKFCQFAIYVKLIFFVLWLYICQFFVG